MTGSHNVEHEGISAIARFRTYFTTLLDKDSVIPFVWVYYVSLTAFGLYAVVWSEPVGSVAEGLGRTFYGLWTWMNIVGTVSVMAGLGLRHGGMPLSEMSGRQLFSDWLGLWMQLGGHACMFFVLLTFEVAAIGARYWGEDAFVVFAIAPYVMGCAMLAIQTARKLLRSAQL